MMSNANTVYMYCESQGRYFVAAVTHNSHPTPADSYFQHPYIVQNLEIKQVNWLSQNPEAQNRINHHAGTIYYG